ncbi:glyoxal reductase-like [Anthonomus grandis grandis]|uniref:glyoxal reductase-like n=1 Tax=Anthonomus grandis grandis TaxID=2921223 RepID=UPI002165BBC8|nr:glyoxal reductase-like [Anthonomus grandis grandis]
MSFKMHSGDLIPLIGFGTYMVDGFKQTKEVLDNALSVGYRLFDTAKMYGNETEIGRALKELLPKHKLTRRDIFITTKLLPSDHGKIAYAAIEESLSKLDCEYLDLYLIHWPGSAAKLRAESWRQMVKAKNDGLVRNIGVSNYTVRHLEEILNSPEGVLPAVNQIEWHPYYHPYEVLEFCKKHGILVQAYMPLGSGSKTLLNDPHVAKIAERIGKTRAQVILKWSVQQGVGVIPKAATKSHMEDNIKLDFTLSDEDMNTLCNLKKRTKYDWDPESLP